MGGSSQGSSTTTAVRHSKGSHRFLQLTRCVPRSATDLALSLRDQLKNYSSNAGSASTLVESETNIRVELLKSQRKVEHFENLLAVSAEHKDGDIAAVGKRALEMEERIKVLESSCTAAEAVCGFHSIWLNRKLTWIADRAPTCSSTKSTGYRRPGKRLTFRTETKCSASCSTKRSLPD